MRELGGGTHRVDGDFLGRLDTDNQLVIFHMGKIEENSMMLSRPFGVRLKQARKKAKLSTRQAAAAAGVSQPYWSHMETGRNDPTEAIRKALERVARLCNVLGCEPDDLIP